MSIELSPVEVRAAVHRALGEPSRLAVVDALVLSDRTPGQLRALTGMDSNLLAFHLDVLERTGLVDRRRSEGDGRRRYVRLRPGALDRLGPSAALRARWPLFVCTGNSARSPFAAGLWRRRTGGHADSAGARPAMAVHPLAVRAAAAHGVDLSGTAPKGYAGVTRHPDVVVSVCDRASEGRVPFPAPRLHWSVPDPVEGDASAFEAAFAEIAARVDRLVGAVS